jgi:DNA polymerase III subunit beta
MNISCDRERMAAAFHAAATVAPSRTPKSILQNVKLDASGSQVIMMATDMDVGVRIQVEGVEIAAQGSAVLPVDRFGSILRENSDARLQIETTSQDTHIRGDRSEFHLPSRNPDEFPEIREFEEQKYHEISARLFRELTRRTVFATDVESTRYALGGVLLEFEDNRIIAVGTDGRRLAKMEGAARSVNGHQGGDAATIVPTRSMQLIERALAETEGELHIAGRGNDVVVRCGAFQMYSRLVEGRFPKWRDVFPQRTKAVKIEMTVGPVLSAVRQASIVTSQDSRGLDFTFGDGLLVLSGATAEVGQSRVEFPVPYEGEKITVTLDHRYVIDFLRVLDPQKTFTLEIENAESAALLSTDDGYGYVVMPLARDR